MKREDLMKEFKKCHELAIQKDAQYGESWKMMRVPSLVDVIVMKLQRCIQLTENTQENKESIRDQLQDTINYCGFALIKLGDDNVGATNVRKSNGSKNEKNKTRGER